MHRLSDTSAMFSTIIWKQRIVIGHKRERERERERGREREREIKREKERGEDGELFFTYVIDLCTAKPHSTRVQSAITEKRNNGTVIISGFRSKELVSKFRGTSKFKECWILTFFLASRCRQWLRRGHSIVTMSSHTCSQGK